MGRIAGEVINAISVDPEEMLGPVRPVLMCFVVFAMLIASGCTQHAQRDARSQPRPLSTVTANAAASAGHATFKEEPAILGLAEEQDIESHKMLRCQTKNVCR